MVYLHDIEFVARDIVLRIAIPALAELQQEGTVRMIGICGYPLDALDEIIRSSPHPLQVVQSYSHLTLQNDKLLAKAAAWQARGIFVVNAAPLSMGLLTTRGPPEWHPALPGLRAACSKALSWLHSNVPSPSVESLAIQYSLDVQRASNQCISCTVVGSIGAHEVLSSVACRDAQCSPLDQEMVAQVHTSKVDIPITLETYLCYVV